MRLEDGEPSAQPDPRGETHPPPRGPLPRLMERLQKLGTLPLSIVGGVVFLVVFAIGYGRIDPELYQVRDDGVITMSHARNLVDYGFIGVNPSGERVEGTSAPVQLFVYAASYALGGVDYARYAQAQTWIFTFLLGALFVQFFREDRVRGIVVTALGAFILSRYVSFMQWHGSGMENAITHVLFLGSLLALFDSVRHRSIRPWTTGVLFLASISRIDSVYHVAPMLVVYSGFWLARFRDLRAFWLSASVFGLWAVFQAWRYWYFGDLLPNTAYAQEISIGNRIERLLAFDRGFIVESAQLGWTIFRNHAGYLLASLLPTLWSVRRDRALGCVGLILVCGVATACLNPFLFGRTRLDPVRSTTHVAVFIAVAISLCLHRVPWKGRGLLICALSITIGYVGYRLHSVRPYRVCCTVRLFDEIRREFAEIARAESLPRPTVANPDLGIMSWHKQFNVVDLGMLGSPLLATIDQKRALGDYFFDYAAPDIVESHPYWTCRYLESIFRDPRFRARYAPIREQLANGRGACTGTRVLSGIWVRKAIQKDSGTRERVLIDDLKRELSVERLARELLECQSSSDRPCAYVARAAYRFLPELRRRGDARRLHEIFASSRTGDYDRFLLEGYRDAQLYLAASALISERREPDCDPGTSREACFTGPRDF